jgi:hypothetical protein
MRWGLVTKLAVIVLLDVAAFCACDTIDRDAPQRSYTPPPPDASDPINNPTNEGGGGTDGGTSDATSDSPINPLAFDPATLPLSAWWRAAYGGSPWVGIASAGTSKGRDLAEATNAPIVGTPINGHTPARFDGLNDILISPVAVADFFAVTGYEIHGLFSADSAKPLVPGSAFNLPAFMADGIAGRFYVGFSTAGVVGGHYDGVAFREIASPCATGGLHSFQLWFDGTKLSLAIDGGATATPVPTAAPAFLGTLRIGLNYTGQAGFDGVIVELMTAPKVLDATQRAGIRSYFNARYGTAFPAGT